METIAPSPAETSTPLLPRVLLAPASYLWLWVLPLALVALLNYQAYWLVGSELNPEQRARAWLVGGAGLANLLAGIAVYAAARFGRGRDWADDHPLWGLPGLVVQIAYLWFAVASLNRGLLLPRNVGAWIYSEGRFAFNQFAFCMLPAFHGVLRLAASRAPKFAGRSLALSVLIAVGAPVGLYVLLESLGRFSAPNGSSWQPYFIATAVIVAGVLLFVAVLRALMTALRWAQNWHATGERWAVVVLALGLPLAGLTLNRTVPFPVDLQATEVYVLTVANALVLLFAVWTGAAFPRLSWLLLCATSPFSLYFFVIFLPYTPLSVLALIAMGLGMLVLTPILLFGMHLHLLNRAWKNARGVVGRGRLLGLGALGLLALPVFFTARNLADKFALNAALDHLHNPTVAAGRIEFRSSLGHLRRALDSHRSYKEGLYYPLLSDYYAWLVFDHLVLPDRELDTLERVFFGKSAVADDLDPFRQDSRRRGRASDQRRLRRVALPPQTVVAENVTLRTAPEDTGAALVTLGISLRNTSVDPAEYAATLALPAGVYVRGFRLQVGDALVPGRLFERKTALWVYSMIRDWQRRDPGVLSYRSATELELRVFPIAPGKATAVEIDLQLPARGDGSALRDFHGTLPEALARVGQATAPAATLVGRGEWVVTGLDRADLPAATREPYLHLIVDRSQDNGFGGDLADILPELRARFPAARVGRVTLANFAVAPWRVSLEPLERLAQIRRRELDDVLPLAGGLALDLALAHALRAHRDADLDVVREGALPPRPVFVIVSRSAATKTLELPLADAWTDLVPELSLCELGADGSFVTHRGSHGLAAPMVRSGDRARPVLSGRAVRGGAASPEAWEYWDPVERHWKSMPGIPVGADRDWRKAVELGAQQQDHDRSPGEAAVDRRKLVEASRATGVLLPSSAYIVVENQAQWRMLQLSESQKLGQNQALDFVETPAPPEWWIAAGFALWLIVRKWRGHARWLRRVMPTLARRN